MLELVWEKSSLGEGHPNVRRIKHNLAEAYFWQGKWVGFRKIQLESLEARGRALSDDHGETMHSYTNLGVLYWEQGLWEQALDCLEKVVTNNRRLGMAKHSLRLTIYYFNLPKYTGTEEVLRDYVEAFDRGVLRD